MSWILASANRHRILVSIFQPMTARQIAGHARLARTQCSHGLSQLSAQKLLCCLTPSANASRLYWLTQTGIECQARVNRNLMLPTVKHEFLELDWEIYGMMCFRHRHAVLRAMRDPMQPVHIKRRALYENPGIRMSANNVRDVLRFLKSKCVVQPVRMKKRRHLHYELTESGKAMRKLLLRAERI